MWKRLADILKMSRKDVRGVTSTKYVPETYVPPNIFHQICLKHYRVSCFIVLGFWRNVLKASYKGPKVTSGGWRSPDVPRTSILNMSKKLISVVIFSVLMHQMCVLDTKKLVITYSFGFGETSCELPRNVPKWRLQHDVLGTSSGHHLNILQKVGFQGNFSVFPDTRCIPDIAEPK